MQPDMIKILLIEDDQGDEDFIREILVKIENPKTKILSAKRVSLALKLISEHKFDIILCDLGLPDSSGVKTFSKIHDKAHDTPVIILSGLNDEATAIKTIENGAQDYLVKGTFDDQILMRSIKYSIERWHLLKEIEKTTKMRDKFISLITHDLHNPISLLSTSFNILNTPEVYQSLTEKQIKILGVAKTTLNRSKQFLNEILCITRLRTGHFKPDFRFINTNRLLSKIINNIEPLAKQKGIYLIDKISDNKRIHTDSALFSLVIDNLISNAVKFCRKGDTITIYLQGDATIVVSDNGPGIKSELLENIFNYNVLTSTKGSLGERGTGLGMPLSFDIMELINGKLSVNSKEGEGTAFYAELPDKKPVILIVDDEELFRVIQMDHLKETEAIIIEAQNGKEAIDILKKTTPHLIITDIKMPEMDGLELIDEVKNNPELADIPVIIVTALTGVDIRNEAFRKGADDFISKPLNPEELIPRVKKIIG